MFNGKTYSYTALEDKKAFLKEYSFLKFDLLNEERAELTKLPEFFTKFVKTLRANAEMSKLLKIDDKKDDFTVLCDYARLPQDTQTYYFKLEE